jgi:hypothetical protein
MTTPSSVPLLGKTRFVLKKTATSAKKVEEEDFSFIKTLSD